MRILLLLSFLVSFSILANSDFKEKGSNGALGVLTDDKFKGGYTRLEQDWSFAFLFHGEHVSEDDNHIHTTIRMTHRSYLGAHNYFTMGFEFAPEITGTGTYSDTGKTYSRAFKNYHFGPTIGLDRYFSGTNLMLTFWVLPVSISREQDTKDLVNWNTHYFMYGGVGVAYVF